MPGRLIVPSGTQAAVGQLEVRNPLLALTQFPTDELVDDSKGKLPQYSAIARQANSEPAYKQLSMELRKRQERAIAASGYRSLPALELRTRGALVCGMSSPTLLEVGLTLFRPHGIPYIAASTVKGVIASWLGQILTGESHPQESRAEKALQEAALLSLFRRPDGKEGLPEDGVIFFDALATSWKLAVDVTTPHHAGWYQNGGAKPPDGVENPVPIYFLTVASGAEFAFQFALRTDRPAPYFQKEVRDRLDAFRIPPADSFSEWWKSVVKSTADYRGFGAQTGGGYGHFGP